MNWRFWDRGVTDKTIVEISLGHCSVRISAYRNMEDVSRQAQNIAKRIKIKPWAEGAEYD